MIADLRLRRPGGPHGAAKRVLERVPGSRRPVNTRLAAHEPPARRGLRHEFGPPGRRSRFTEWLDPRASINGFWTRNIIALSGNESI